MTGIICAMKIEAEKIIASIENPKTEVISGIEFTSGTIYNKPAVVAVCGIGKVFAALCTQTMILKYKPECVINVGVAGSLCKKLKVLDIAIAENVVQHDMDTSAIGDPVGLISGINIIKIPCSKSLNDKIIKCMDSLDLHYERGTIASGDRFVDNREEKNKICHTFDAIACEMEGGAVGQVCYINNVEFSVIRAISDEEGGDYAKFAARAAENSAKVIDTFFKL